MMEIIIAVLVTTAQLVLLCGIVYEMHKRGWKRGCLWEWFE